ncbi:splicing factor ESS-2 family protein [Aspergillus ibericus CBS 121593]|uniref:Nuclear protein Es2 n=1 Tax=Aspergillus ibericus CBS 121593 TaxID=1448316 RepID=A0A395HEU4_9EURO|nr:nuclear protein Es2 [Aspergillus ibericus CBS 121593]RAL05635.1 nuclear protein Es2 [Aspergillus ibericus CBS 121593]
MSAPSQALTKRQSDTSLMPPPPPPKRLKRPATVLDEDVYTNALSEIIARDYFPGLLEAQVKQEYLDALDSRDKEWIANSKKKLTDLMRTPGRARSRPGSASMTPQHTGSGRPGDTPMGWGGDTPMSVMSAASSTTPSDNHVLAPDVSRLGLLEFQAKYTSEDNESFNKVLDKQNEKHRERYKWLWSGNKIPTARQIAHRRREVKRIEAQGGNPDQHKQVAIKTDLDARPANPDTWKTRPENSLMFAPSSIEDSYETIQQKAEATSRAGPKRVVFQNTRLPDESLHQAASDASAPPPSPSISAIKDAIAGRPRPTESEPGYTGGETPRVNGYAFVDEDELEYPITSSKDDDHAITMDDLRLLGGSDATPNPFEIKENRRREDIHHRMVDRVARSRRAEKSARDAKTPVTPRFASSPRLDFGLRTPGAATPGGRTNKALTPAAQKLLHQMGNTPRLGSTAKSSLRNIWTPTPKRGK